MKIEIEKRNNIPAEIDKYIIKKAERLARYLKKESSIKFVLTQKKGNFFTEITLHNLGNIFHSKAGSPGDIKLSIDEGIEKIEHQFKKFKERVFEHRKKSEREPLSKEKSNKKAPLVKTRRIEPALLFLDDAISEFEEKKEPFFVFINKETNAHNIILKTKNGDYQIIEF